MNDIVYFILRFFSAGFSCLPNWVLHGMACFLAWLAYSVLRVRRPLVESNLEIAFGHEWDKATIQKVAYQTYYHFFLTILEFFAGYQGNMGSWVEFEGEQNLRHAMDQGRGVYLVCLHMGNWEAMASAINQKIMTVHVVVKKVGSDGVNRFVEYIRRKNNFPVIDRKRKGDGIRKILQILSQKGAIGFVMDQSRPGEPKLPFFGKDAKTNTALASLLCKSPAPVLLGYAKRLGVRRHTVVFTPELDLQFSGDKGEDVLSISAQFNQEIELAIRQCPEQYLWLHNRWK